MEPTKPKRGHGEGTLRELPNGRWRGEVVLGGERRSVTGATRQEARRALDDLRRRHRQGLLAARSAERESVAAYLRRWLAGQRPRLEAHS